MIGGEGKLRAVAIRAAINPNGFMAALFNFL